MWIVDKYINACRKLAARGNLRSNIGVEQNVSILQLLQIRSSLEVLLQRIAALHKSGIDRALVDARVRHGGGCFGSACGETNNK